MKITAYRSEEGCWLAMIDFGRAYMPFFANTKDEAVAKATSFLEAEKARQLRLVGSASQVAAEPENRTSVNPGGRGLHFAGKVWMLNRQTGHKVRVDPLAVAGFEATGYVRGGPRSK